jgi:hypothetical protein
VLVGSKVVKEKRHMGITLYALLSLQNKSKIKTNTASQALEKQALPLFFKCMMSKIIIT